METIIQSGIMQANQHSTRYSKGMTLIELMVVLVMVGIMTMMAAPSVNGIMDRWALKASASDVKNKIRLTQSYAIANPDSRYFFECDGDSLYRVFLDSDESGDYSVADELLFSHPLSDGITIDNSELKDKDNTTISLLRFYGDRSVSGGGLIVLNGQGSQIKKISILQSTGRVKIL